MIAACDHDVRRILRLPKPLTEELHQRVGIACHAAHVAFAPFEVAAMSGKHAQYAGLPERIFDVEYFELAGIRIQKLLAGRCTLSAMLDKSPIDEVEKYEDAAREYIAEMNKLAAELGLTMPH